MNFEKMIDNIVAGTKAMIAKAINPLEARIKAIESAPPAAAPEPLAPPSAEEIAKAMEPIFSVWALGFERKADDILQRTIDRMPKPKDGRDGKDGANGKDGERGVDGRDGNDAFDLDSFECSLGDDGRTVTLSFKCGDETICKSVRLPAMLYKGVFSRGTEYSENDVVTYGGSMFIATKDAPNGAPGSSDDWKLSVKRGRDGKDGRNGIDKTATVPAKRQ